MKRYKELIITVDTLFGTMEELIEIEQSLWRIEEKELEQRLAEHYNEHIQVFTPKEFAEESVERERFLHDNHFYYIEVQYDDEFKS